MSRVRRTHGVAAVEFALVLPFLMLLLAGIMDFGRAYSLRVTLTNAAREGARYAAGNPTDTSGIASRVNDEVAGSNIKSISSNKVTVSTPDGTDSGDPVYVTISYTWKPFMGTVLGIGDQTLRARASMVILPGA